MKVPFAVRPNRSLFAEQLEPRLLFDGAPDFPGLDIPDVDVSLPASVATALQEQSEVQQQSEIQASREIAFVSRDIPDFGLLLADLAANKSMQVVLLDNDLDGLQQIASALQGRSDWQAVHILTHGDEGTLQLGGTQLDSATMQRESQTLAAIGDALADDADLMIYGCRFGAGRGAESARLLSELTGADVAASTDFTGHVSHGGDWDLELQLGSVTTVTPFSGAAESDWVHVLFAEPSQLNWDDVTFTSGDASATFTVNATDVTIDTTNAATNYPQETTLYALSGGNGDGQSLRYYNNNNASLTAEILFDQPTYDVTFTLYDIDNSDDFTISAFNGTTQVDLTSDASAVNSSSATFNLTTSGLSVDVAGTGTNSGGNSTNGSVLFQLNSVVDRIVISETNGSGNVDFALSDIDFSDEVSGGNSVNTITEEDVSTSGSVFDNAGGPGIFVSAVNGASGNVGQDVTLAHGSIRINADGTYVYTLDNSDPQVQALNYTGNTVFVGSEDSSGNGVIVELDLNTGTSSVASTTTLVPYVNGLAANADNNLVYYADDDNIYYWDRAADTHHTLASINGDLSLGDANGLLSGGATYHDGVLYVGLEPDSGGDMVDIYALSLDSAGTAVTSVTNLNVAAAATSAGFANVGGFGDLIYSGGSIYGATTDAGIWSFDLSTNAFQQIDSTYPGQLAATVDGRVFVGNGTDVRQIDLSNGQLVGPSQSVSQTIFDMSSAISAPQDPAHVLTEAVTYEITDSSGSTIDVTLTVTIDGLNDAPEATDHSATFNIDSANNAMNLPLPTDVDDAQNDLLITIDQLPLGAQGTITIGSGGTVVSAGDVLTLSEFSQLHFTPAAGYTGTTQTLEWTVTDPGGLSDSASVTIEVIAPSISINDVTVDEDAGTAEFTVSLDQTTSGPVNVNWATANDTADGSDFTADSGVVSFAAGETTKTISIAITDDSVFENSESFFVNLTGALGATIADAQGIGTILDNGSGTDDDRPAFSVDDVSVTEGTDAHSVFTVSLSNLSTEDVVVSLATSDGTADSPDDFSSSLEYWDGTNWQAVPASNEVTIAAGTTSVQVRTAIVDDVYADNGELFSLTATRVSGTTTNGSASGTGTINDDTDTALVSLVGPTSVNEGSDGTFTVSVDHVPLTDVTVNLSYLGTATNGDDFTGQASVTILAGETTATFDVTTDDDSDVEGAEDFTVSISGVSGGGFEDVAADPSADDVTTTIVDNDLPAISIDDVTVDEDAGTAVFTVTLDQAPVAPASINWATAIGSADGSDFTADSGVVSFAAGETTNTISIAITDDSVFENSESFFVNLTGALGATIADAQGIGTILDDGSGPDDDRPALSVNDVSVTEGTDAHSVFTVSLSNLSTEDVVVSLATSDGTAESPDDFSSSLEYWNGTNWQAVPASNEVTISAGTTSVQVRSAIVDDVYADNGETFSLTATRVSGTTTNASASGTGTINDDVDTALVSLVGPTSVNEGSDGTFTVSVDHSPLTDVTVNLSYSGTATNGDDFTGQTGVTILAGETTASFDITADDDSDVEDAEDFTVSISGVSGGGFEDVAADPSADDVTTTIVDNDLPAISIDDVTVDEDAGTAVFTVTLDQAPVAPASINWATAIDSADGSDFTADSGVVSFAAGETTTTISILITDDSVFENSESFFVNLTGALGATIADAQGIGTILDDGSGTDDDRPALSVGDVSVTEGTDPHAAFTVSLSNLSTEDVVVSLATSDGTADSPDDFSSSLEYWDGTNWQAVPASNEVTIAAGTTSVHVRSAIVDDVYADNGETFSLTATRVSGTTTNVSASGTGRINDDVDTALVSLVGPTSVNEGSDGTFTVSVDHTPLTDVTVNLSYSGTATNGDDFTGQTSVTILAGETTASFDITTDDDSDVEGVEDFTVSISGVSGGGFEDVAADPSVDDATTTIVDNDLPAISIDDVTVHEDAGTAVFTVTLDQSPVAPASINWATAIGSADGSDFTADSGVVSFAAGETTKTISILITDDSVFENSESFFVNLTGALGATIADAQGIGTILDDGSGTDDDRPALSVGDVSVTEGTDPHAVFTVSLSNLSTEDVVVSLATSDGTADSPGDFSSSLEYWDGTNWQAVPASNEVTISAGTTSVQVRSAIVDDVYADNGETFSLTATRVSGTTANVSASGTGTINDDVDTALVSLVGPTSVNEGSDGTFTVSVDHVPLTDVTVNLSYSGMATNGDDFTGQTSVTILAGETTATFVITTDDDSDVEGAETFTVGISGVSSGGFEDVAADPSADDVTTTIVDNDLPAIIIDDVTVDEDAGTAVFTVTLDQSPVAPASINWATANGTADGSDFTADSGVVSFAAGETTKTISIAITDDSVFENSESFFVNLTGALGATIADAQGIGTILDNGSGTDDDRPAFSVDDVSVTEGTDAHSVFTVSLSNLSTEDVVVSLATSDGTADSPDDFSSSLEYWDGTNWQAVPASNEVTIAAGTTSVQVRTAIVDDVYADNGELFSLTATRVSGTTTNGSASGTGTINDDTDTALVSLVGPTSVNEGSDGTFTVTVDHAPLTDVTVNLSYSGTATHGDDFTGQTSITILAGETTATFDITTDDDSVVEGDEQITVEIVGVNGGAYEAVAADPSADDVTTTIVDNDSPGILINDVTVDEAAGTAAFTVSLNQSPVAPITVNWSTADGSANGSDYTSGAGTVTFAAGETTQTVSVSITDDSVFENSETFTVNLAGAVGASILDGQGIGTIVDNGSISDDDRPEFFVDNVSVTEGTDSHAVFTISLSDLSTEDIVVALNPADATATAPDDYSASLEFWNGTNWQAVPASNEITIVAATSSVQIRTAIVDDVYADHGETFTLTATRISGTTINAAANGTASIFDDVDVATVSLNGPASMTEGSSGTFTLSLDHIPFSDATIDLAYSGTAANGADFTGQASATILAGQSTVTFDITTIDDADVEGSESFNVSISNVSGGGFESVVANPSADDVTTTIFDNDVPAITINDVTVNEDVGTAIFTVSLDRAPVSPVSVDWGTADGTADVADYTSATGTVNFAAGETTQTISVLITDDSVFENSEFFAINLSGASGATILDGQGIGTIIDNGSGTDDDRPALAISDVTVMEGTDAHAVFNVTLSNESTENVVVRLDSADGTAESPADYSSSLEFWNGTNWQTVPATNEITIAAGTTSVQVRTAIVDDVYADSGETFSVTATRVSGTTSNASDSGVATIVDDSDTALVSLAGPANISEGSDGTFTVSVDHVPLQDVTVNLTYSGTANNGADFAGQSTVTILSGQTSADFLVSTVDDPNVEGAESFTVSLTSVSGGGFESVAAHPSADDVTTTIVDNDLPGITIDDVTIDEDAGTAIFTVSLDQTPVAAVSVDWITADGTADVTDYTPASGTVNFAAGETSNTISVSITDDLVFENSEMFFINLSSASSATISDAQGVGTILDNGTGSDDDRPALLVSEATVTEGTDPHAVFTVSLSNASTEDVVLSVVATDNSAASPADYLTSLEYWNGSAWAAISASNEVTISAGTTTVQVRTAIADDIYADHGETFTLVATRISGTTVNTSAAGTGTILDDMDSALVTLSGPTSVAENGTATYSVTLDHVPLSDVTINLGYTGSASLGTDFSAPASVTILAGETSATFDVTSVDDMFVEGNETFTVHIDSASGGGFESIAADPTADKVETTIVDNELPLIRISDATVTEGDTLVFTVSLDQAPILPVSVEWSTANDSANSSDYSPSSGTFNFAAGETSKTISIVSTDDAIDEFTENFVLHLTSSTASTIIDAEGIGTILDNDDAPTVFVADVTRFENDGILRFELMLDSTSAKPISIDFATADGTALAGDDYIAQSGTVSFAAGETTALVDITIVDDAVVEADETFELLLINPVNVALSTDATGTILDDDHAPVGTVPDQVNMDADTVVLDLGGMFSDTDGDSLTVSAVGLPAGIVLGTDGVLRGTIHPSASQNGPLFDGVYLVEVDVSDGTNVTSTSFQWTIGNPIPVAEDDSFSTNEDVPLTILPSQLLGNDVDPDGDILRIDGIVRGPNFGILTEQTDGSFVYSPNANHNGSDSFEYQITDGEGGFSTATVTITIVPQNDPPVAIDDYATTREDESAVISILSNDRDVEGDVFIVSTTNPSHGAVTVNSDGTVDYSPDANFFGTDSFTYTIEDEDGATDTATVWLTVTSENDGPNPQNDYRVTQEDQAITIDVLANDSDPEDDALVVFDFESPTNGTVTFAADGLIYTPDDGFSGADSFTYTVQDIHGATEVARVDIDVTPKPTVPPIAVDDKAETTAGTPVVISILDNDSDVDSPFDLTGTSVPAHGTLTRNSDGSVTYQPDAGFTGRDFFVYTIADPDGGFSHATVNIVVHAEPVADVGIAKDMTLSGTTSVIRITLQNFGNDTAVDLSVVDDLTAAFGTNRFSVESVDVIQEPVDAASIIVLNADYNGATNTNLLHSLSSLEPGDGAILEITVQLRRDQLPTTLAVFTNIATVSGTDTEGDAFFDSSQDGIDPDPDGDSDPGNNSQPSEVVWNPPVDAPVTPPEEPVPPAEGPFPPPDEPVPPAEEPAPPTDEPAPPVTPADATPPFAFDSFNDLSRHHEQRALWEDANEMFRRELILSKQISSLAPEPIFSGSARPGTQIVGRIVDGNGRIVAQSMAFTDPGGNWMMQFHRTSGEQNYRIEFEEIVGAGDPFSAHGDIYGYRGMEREANDYAALQPWTKFGEPYSLGRVLRQSATSVLDAQHRQNADPLGLNSGNDV